MSAPDGHTMLLLSTVLIILSYSASVLGKSIIMIVSGFFAVIFAVTGWVLA